MNYFLKRPLLCMLCSSIFGLLVAFFLSNSWKLILAVSALIIFGILCFFNKIRKISALCLLPLILTLMFHFLFVRYSYQPMLSFCGKDLEIEGKVISDISSSETSSGFIIKPNTIIFKNQTHKPSGNVSVFFKKNAKDFEIGSVIRCKCTAFEYEEDEYLINYSITEKQFLTVYASELKMVSSPSKFDFHVILSNARQKITDLYMDVFSQKAAALISGITLGQKSMIDLETYAAFRNSGVSHTLAVSGMHLAFVTSILWFVLSALCPSLRVRAILQLMLIWGFTALTGFSPSCCRAAIMLSVCQIGILVRKEPDTLTSLALAVVLCCLENPFSILNPSLALSASATLGLALLGGPISKLLPKVSVKGIFGNIQHFVITTVSMSVAATVGTLPVMVLMFQSVSLLAPIANVFILPAIEILFTLGFAVIFFAWFKPIAIVISFFGNVFAQYCAFITGLISKIPFSTVYTNQTGIWIVITILIFFLGLLFILLKKKQKLFIPCCLAVFAGMIFLNFLYDFSIRSVIDVEIIDVRQGNTAMIHNGHDAVFIDCGGNGTGWRSINTELLKNNIKSISSIYITHMDLDHIRYGSRLLNTYQIDTLYIPFRRSYSDLGQELIDAAKKRNTKVIYVTEDQTVPLWNLGRLTLLTKHIDPNSEDENENSLVYQFSYGKTTVLFTGDVRKEGEQRLNLSYRNRLKSDILIVSHHGATGGSYEEFLSFVKAKTAVISVGEDNMFEFPSPTVLRRLGKHIDTIYQTDLSGTISFRLNGTDYQQRG